MKRHTQRKGWTINDITQMYTFTDIDEAADMEKELNLKYGYGWNSSRDYRIVIAKAPAGGKRAAEINVASGQIAELGRSAMGVEALWKQRGIQIKRKNGKL